MSRSNHSRTKKTKYDGRDYRDRVGHPNEHIKTPIKKRAEQSKKRIQKTVELNLHEIIGENEKQPDHEKILNKLIQGVEEKKTLKEKRIQEKYVEQNLHEIIGVNEKQPDHEKALNKLIRSNQEEMNSFCLKTSKLVENGSSLSYALLKTNEIGLVEKKEEKINDNEVNETDLTECGLGKEGYDDLSKDFGIDEEFDEIPKISQYLSIPKKIRESISCYPEETKPFQNYLNFLYFVENHPNIQKLMQEHSRKSHSQHFKNFRYSDDIIIFFKKKMAQKDLNKWLGKPVDSSKIEEMKETIQLIKKFNSNPNVENKETEPWKLIKWVVEHGIGEYTVLKISKMVPLHDQTVNSHLRLMFKEKYRDFIIDKRSEGNIRHRLVTNVICKGIKNNSQYTGHFVEPGIPFPDYKYRLDHFLDVKYGEKYLLIDTTHDMKINSIVKKLIAYPPGDKAVLLVVITNPCLTQDYENILYNQIFQFNEKMRNMEGLKRDFIPKTTLKRFKLINWKEFAHVLGIEENSEEWKELEKICTIDRKGLLEMEKNADNQNVKRNQDFEEFLKSRKVSDIFARPDTYIRDNINYLTGLKEHYPNVLNFIQFAQNLYKDDPDPSVNYVQINSFLKSNNEIIEPLNPYWNNFDTTKILNGLCENDSVSKIGKNGYKITESLSNDNNANVNIILLDETIKGIFRRKNPPIFKEIHKIIDSHVTQYYRFKEKWQPIDSYKILKYYEKNLDGFSIKKKLNKSGSLIVDRHNLVVGKNFPSGDGNAIVTVDKDFVYCYPSINLKEGAQQAPVIYNRNTWERIQFYQLLDGRGAYFPKQSGETVIDLKQHYPIVLNFIQFAQNLYKDDPDSSVNYGQINSFLQANNEFISSLDSYWSQFDTIKILNRLCENDSISKIGKNDYKITESLSNDNNANVNIILLDETIKGIFRRKNPPIFKEIHKIIDSHVTQYYRFKEKWQPIDSYKILKYYEKNLDGFSIKKKLNKSGSFIIGRHNLVVGKNFPSGDGNAIVTVDKDFVYCYPSINLKEGAQQTPVIYNRNTWERIQFYQILDGGRDESGAGLSFQGADHKRNHLNVGAYFPKQSGETVLVRLGDKEDEVKIFPDLDAKNQPIIFKKSTSLLYKKVQYYVPINELGKFIFSKNKLGTGGSVYRSRKTYNLGKEYKNKIMVLDLDNPLTITFYPEQVIDKPGIVFNKITARKIQFYQNLEENGGFVYENKIYSFPEHAGKNVLIKIDEIEKKILCFPEGNLEDEPLVRPINESKIVQFYKKNFYKNRFMYMSENYSLGLDFPIEKAAVTISENRIYLYPDLDFNKPPLIFDRLTGNRIQFYKKLQGKNNLFNYLGKRYSPGADFPSEKVVATVTENRIYIYPDQDFNNPPLIFNRLTGNRIQFYQKLHNEGEFRMYKVKFDLGAEHKNKLAVVRIYDEKNEIYVFPDGILNKIPLVFNKTSGKKK